MNPSIHLTGLVACTAASLLLGCASPSNAPTPAASKPLVFSNSPTYFYGVQLVAKPTSMQLVQDRALALCDKTPDKQSCLVEARKELLRMDTATEHRALALGTSAVGYGYQFGSMSADQAWAGALMRCSLTSNNPKLCEVVGVNQYETASLYDLSATQSAAAVIKLQSLGFQAPKILATGAQLGAATALPDIKTWSTLDVLRAYQANGGALRMIDVNGVTPLMLPNALHIVNAGMDAGDAAKNQSLSANLGKLLAAAYPNDKTSPIVFYCSGAGCPFSSNAAQRVSALGYTQVGWYEGGFNEWQAAGLPTVQKVPRAVVW